MSDELHISPEVIDAALAAGRRLANTWGDPAKQPHLTRDQAIIEDVRVLIHLEAACGLLAGRALRAIRDPDWNAIADEIGTTPFHLQAAAACGRP